MVGDYDRDRPRQCRRPSLKHTEPIKQSAGTRHPIRRTATTGKRVTPGGTASSVFVLAKETGWSFQTIMWEIPLHLVHQAEHVFMYINGVKLRRPYTAIGTDIRDMEKALGL